MSAAAINIRASTVSVPTTITRLRDLMPGGAFEEVASITILEVVGPRAIFVSINDSQPSGANQMQTLKPGQTRTFYYNDADSKGKIWVCGMDVTPVNVREDSATGNVRE